MRKEIEDFINGGPVNDAEIDALGISDVECLQIAEEMRLIDERIPPQEEVRELVLNFIITASRVARFDKELRKNGVKLSPLAQQHVADFLCKVSDDELEEIGLAGVAQHIAQSARANEGS
jgi:hypothetical protein